MAKELLQDCVVDIGGTDLMNAITSVEIAGDAETRDATGFGDTHRVFVVGFKNWTVTMNFHHDFADNAFNELLFGWWGTTVAFKARKQTGIISPTNPEYQGNVIFTTVPVFNANVGEISGGSITLQGTGTLVRAVA